MLFRSERVQFVLDHLTADENAEIRTMQLARLVKQRFGVSITTAHGDIKIARAKLADAVSQHMSAPLPLIGSGELVSAAAATFRDSDAAMVVEGGKPVGVITRSDLLGFLSDGPRRK